ncbi:MAG: imidazole glycerol phosphate synthase subunit HisH, partial [Muribaculum sp.]|nr:imidazole glycerol phosphate synthase subunit HisH [Muribaculum sp.]
MIAVVRYNAGNVFSVECALNRLGVEFVLTADEQTLLSADKVIFPGVGEAAAAMFHLRTTGLDRVLRNLT